MSRRDLAEAAREQAVLLAHLANRWPHGADRNLLREMARAVADLADEQLEQAALADAREASPIVPEASPRPRGPKPPVFGALLSPQGIHSTGQ